ncbi:MAG: FlgD immunoglobulin-like domain containing protein [Candidatus Eiseniibacteriota bacterium]
MSAELGAGWRAQVDRRTGAVHAAWGEGLALAPGLRDTGSAAAVARGFLIGHADLLRTASDQTVLASAHQAGGKFAVWFQQEIAGVPVYGARAFALLTESGRLAAFGSDFLELHSAPPAAVLSAGDARVAATAALGTVPRDDRPETTELVLLPVPSGELLELGPAWVVTFESFEPFGRWITIVDARSGGILSRRNGYGFIDVVGTAVVSVEQTGYCHPATNTLPAGLGVNVVGGGSGVTTTFGAFTIPHAGSLPVLLTSTLQGPLVDVNRAPGLGADASLTAPAAPGIPVTIRFDDTNSRRDERNAFFHINDANAFMKAIDPTFTSLDYAVPASVGRFDFICPGNAWWDGVGMGLCEESGVFGNTGRMETVIVHEFGHGVTNGVYSRHGVTLTSAGLSEGNSDVLAAFSSRSSVIGEGWTRNDCNSILRDAQNALRWPDDVVGGSGHWDGQIIAGFHWDLWQSLQQSHPSGRADSIAWTSWHLSRDLGLPQDLPDQVLWTFLADDDDADLGNGTPSYAHICLGASNHGFECPEGTPPVTITHSRLGHVTDGSVQREVVATVLATVGLNTAALTTNYRVSGGGFVALPMISTGNPDEYAATLPALPPSSEVEYYIFARDLQDSVETSPAGAPGALHAFDVAWLYDPLETESGWTAGDPADDALYGEWGRFDPVGTIAQPEDDGTAALGVMCFVTGQCGPGYGTCWSGCNLGCNDVDDGQTTLFSPVYDLGALAAATVKYDRWYSNDLGANPTEDSWVVDVSNDGGASWTNVENTTESDASWQTRSIDLVQTFGAPGLVQLRFRASDLANPSLVEAAVDDVRILSGGPSVDAVVGPLSAMALALEQNRPNPFRPGTLIEYAVPERSRIRLSVHDVSGRTVRVLAEGEVAAGRRSVAWDGRDGTGTPVASGVYFYRLASPHGNLTRKLTVAP